MTLDIESRPCVNRISQIILKGTVKGATKKHTTYLATLLQNKLSSDVACFTTNSKPVFQQIRLLTGLNLDAKCV